MATFSPSSFSVPAEPFTEKGGYIKLTILNAQDSDQATNKVTITWKLTVEGTPWVNLSGYYATLGGVTIVPKWTGTKSNWNAGDVLASGSTTFDRNPDGTLSLQVYLKQLFYYGYSDARWEMPNRYQDKSGTLSLSQLYRVSQMTMSDTSLTTNSAVTLTTNSYSPNFTHTFQYSFGSQNNIPIASGVVDSTTWTPPRTLLEEIPNSPSGSGTVYCYTYSGGTYIGVSSQPFTLTADSTVKPTIASSSTISDGNSQISALDWGVYVRTKSYLTASMSGSGVYNSTIISYRAKIEDITYSADSVSALNNTLANVGLTVGNRTAYLSVVDSRGRESDEISITYTVADYTPPAINTYNVYRSDAQGNPKESGEYLKCTFNAGIASVSGNNTLTAKIGYKLKSSSTYTYQTIPADTTDPTKVSFDDVLDDQVSPDSSYDIIFYISDLIPNGENYRLKEIGTGFDLMHFNASGKSMAFGKKSEASSTDTKLEVALDTDFIGELTHNGNPIGDTVPVGSIFNYDGTTVPEGYSAVNKLGGLLDLLFPVGFVLITSKPENPSTYYGGTWSQIKDQFILAVGDTYDLDDEGGEAEVELKVSEMPQHTHTQASCTDPGNHVHSFKGWFGYFKSDSTTSGMACVARSRQSGDADEVGPFNSTGAHTHTVTLNNTGGGQAHNNMPPYIAKYVWERIA